MTSKLKYHKNYTEFGEPYQLVLPLNLEGLVPDDDSVRLLSHELEELDYSLLYQAYSAKGRNPAVDPNRELPLYTDAGNKKQFISVIRNCSGVFWIVSCCMIFITADLKEGTVTLKQTLTPLLCI